MKKNILLSAALLTATSIAIGGTYTVIDEDNLWNLSGEFLGDPFQWENIWVENQHIADPDLIYPGDQLVIPGRAFGSSTGDQSQGEDNRAETFQDRVAGLNTTSVNSATNGNDESNAADGSSNSSSTLQDYFNNSGNLYSAEALRSSPYIITAHNEDEEPEIMGLGRIEDDSHPMYGLHSEITAVGSFDEGQTYEFVKSVRYIDHRGQSANVVLPVGAGLVTKVDGDSATFRVTQAWNEISNGTSIIEVRSFESLDNPKVDRSVSQVEVSSLCRIGGIAQEMVKPYEDILLDSGSDVDIAVGDLFVAVEVNEDGELDRQACFQGIIVNVGENSSTLKVHGVYKAVTSADYRLRRFGRLIFE